jgi:Flp pilus assembly protein TadG
MRNFLRNKEGAAAVDFAIVSMVFIFCVLGVIEFGRVLYMKNKLAFAADSAARLVLMKSSGTDTATTSEILIEAKSVLHNRELVENVVLETGSETADGVTYLTLKLSYSMPLYIPGFGSGVTLSQYRKTPQL